MATTPFTILFDDILDFLASTPTPEQIIHFEPSETLKQRFSYLMDQNRHDRLSADERAEMDEFLRMNHFMNMLKLRARQKLDE
jgi:hypothetical protein